MHSREEIVPACQAASISRHAGSANCSKSRSVGSSGAMVPSKSRRTRHHVAGRGDDKRVERSMAGIVCRADYSRKLMLVVGPHTLSPRRRYKRRELRCVPTIDIAVTRLRGIGGSCMWSNEQQLSGPPAFSPARPSSGHPFRSSRILFSATRQWQLQCVRTLSKNQQKTYGLSRCVASFGKREIALRE